MKVHDFAGKIARLKTLTNNSYNFVMKVHHINQDNFLCSVLAQVMVSTVAKKWERPPSE